MKILIQTVISLMMRVMSLYKKLVSPVTMIKVTQKMTKYYFLATPELEAMYNIFNPPFLWKL